MLWQGDQARLYETYCKRRATQPERKRPRLGADCRGQGGGNLIRRYVDHRLIRPLDQKPYLRLRSGVTEEKAASTS